MTIVPGYTVESVIHKGETSIVYRGYRNKDQQRIIIKSIQKEYLTPLDYAKFKHQYEIVKNLDIKGIVQPLDFVNYNQKPFLVLQDFSGVPLATLIQREAIELIEFLRIAIQISDALGELHQHRIIHKDINPGNILINLETNEVKLADFSISSLLSKESPQIHTPDSLEGTLAYMSPEQTGRMNRSVDYRTDFYSLGVTFYEILTRHLPFLTTDPLELVHCHIAKSPTPPDELVRQAADDKPHPSHSTNSVPKVISDIVMKLLSKTAEDRYQSALGLKADLETCLTQLQNTGRIEDFPLARSDKSNLLQIPQKLYGREAEVSSLIAIFEQVSQGPTEMALIAGYSGVGKSSIVNEIHKSLVRRRGYFIAGKFDQFQKNIPYVSLTQAFRELIKQLLLESEAQLQSWRERLLDALGVNAQVVIEVIPEVELIIGQQPPVPRLGSSEAQNRFNLIFQRFIRVFAQRDHPLVLFLDDLQWVDSASLKLIQLLTTDPDSQCLLLIGAYRDNEVDPTHPLMLSLEKIQRAKGKINIINLQPLDLAHVNQLLADTFDEELKQTELLAELVFNKTAGNPFFLTQLLKSLYKKNLVFFDFGDNCWKWDIGQISQVAIASNVVELMVDQLQKLPASTQSALEYAACIGNQFNLQTLSTICEKSPSATAIALWEAVQVGLILPLNDASRIQSVLEQLDEESNSDFLQTEYKFLHDRVQQAAYILIPENQKKETHLKVGQLLLKNTEQHNLGTKIFDIVNQLNLGVELITQPSERDKLARLNLIAGRKAKASTAYEIAAGYIRTGLSLLTLESWQYQYELTLPLYTEGVELEYLNANFEQAEMLSNVVLENAKNLLDKISIYEIKIPFYTSLDRLDMAVDTALKVLEMLGISLPKNPNQARIIASLLHTKSIVLGKKRIETLFDLPVITDPYKLAAIRILVSATPAITMTNQPLLALVVLTMVNLCVKYGNSPFASYAYGMYGLMLCGILGEIEAGYQFGELALRLLDKFDAKELKPKVYTVFNIFIRHWKEHVREAIESLSETIQIGFDTGDLQYVGHASVAYCIYQLFVGENLAIAEHRFSKYVESMQRVKQDFILLYLNMYRQTVLNLVDEAGHKVHLIGESFNEEETLPVLIETNNRPALFYFYVAKSILLYLFRDYQQVVTVSEVAKPYKEAAAGFMQITQHNFYYSLGLLALAAGLDRKGQQHCLGKVAANQKQMRKWANHAPANYQHKWELVEAERARILKQPLRAMALYDRAIHAAREQGYLQDFAIASERAAEFYLALGKEEIAQLYMTKAYYGYINWGAIAKVKELESRYPQLTSKTVLELRTGIKSSLGITTTSENKPEILDLKTVIKASQAISGEISLDKLLAQLMKIVIENAGAQIGVLLLQKQDQLLIQARGFVEQDEVIVHPSTLAETDATLPTSLIHYVQRAKEDVVLDDATHEGRFTTDPYIIKNQSKSILCTPIIYQGELIGLLYLENNLTTAAFTSDRVELLKVLSSQAAISIENALLYQTLEQKVEERTIQLAQAEAKYRSIYENAINGIFQTTPDGSYLGVNSALARMYGYHTPNDLIEGVTSIQQQLYVDPNRRSEFIHLIEKYGVVSGFESQVYRKDHTIIWISEYARAVRDTNGNILYYEGLVEDITRRKEAESALQESLQQLAAANEEITLLNQRLKTENLRMKAELEVTRRLQQMMLPKEQELSQIPELEIAGFMEPAEEVGGDYYDVLQYNDQVKIGIGDITGHGLESGMLMLMVQTAVRTLLVNQETDATKFLNTLNRTVYDNVKRMESGKNLTLSLLDYQSGTLRFSGQHEEIIVVRVGGKVERIDTLDLGFPLGLEPDISAFVSQFQLQLNSGDIVVLYTDGITEAEDANKALYGLDRLCEVISQNWQQSAEEIKQAVIHDVRQHIGEQRVYDDITLLILKQK